MYIPQSGAPMMVDPKFPISIMYPTGGNEGDRAISARTHIHKEVELVYVIRGVMSFIIQNKQIEVSPNQFLFINSSIVHSSCVLRDEEATILLLQFDPDMIYNTHSQLEYKYLTPFINHDQLPFYLFRDIQSSAYSELEGALRKVLSEFRDKEVAYEISIKSALYQILTILYRSGILYSSESGSSNDTLMAFTKLEPVFRYVEEHFQEDITVEKACELASYNYHYFCRLFKAATGKSFIQYLNFVRVSEAEKLLLSTDIPITDVISQTGFKSPSYFNRVFRKLKGCSPSVYREGA